MRRVLVAAAVGLAAAITVIPAVALGAADPGDRSAAAGAKGMEHNLLLPFQKQQQQLQKVALEAKLEGKAKGKVHQVAKGQFVQLERTGTDKVFVILAEFGNARYPHAFFQDAACAAGCTATKFEGPGRNEIPQPDRTKDNTTLWKADYNAAHYEDMYFNRMAKYYESQSSGRYSIEGEVTHWVKVPYNQALYGRDYCGSIVCATTKMLVRDAMAMWVQGELDSGRSMADIQAYLRTYDKQDRYDANANGNFDEPDGFIDHFQIVHAGGDQAAGDPIYGTDAIWSHRWYANLQGGGPGIGVGVDIGTNTGLLTSHLVPNNPTGVWVGDYTIQPENGGLGVFAHEYGHDLGLPDLYDTSGNTGGAENSTGFWSLMSSGANIGDGGPDGIGDAPTDMGIWEKFQLGWVENYAVAPRGQGGKFQLGPAEHNTKRAQALFVLLPNKSKSQVITAPKTGAWAYWSGAGDNLSNTMSKSVTLPAGATISADIWLDTEAHFDYLFLEVSTDGTTWTPVKTTISKPASDDDGHFNGSGAGMGGSSGGAYLPATTTDPLPSGNVQIRFRYETDQNTGGKGAVIDNIAITGAELDGAETDTGWTFNGFQRIENGNGVTQHLNVYIAENRQYLMYDRSLATAYNFGFLDSRPNWVEHFPYQNGLLISYWDETFTNNNVGDHPGGGLVLPVDARPSFHHTYDGHLVRPRILSYDSTFGLEPSPAITIHKNSQPTTIPSQPAVPVFDDRQTWWFNADEHAATGSHVGRYQPGWSSVNVPKTGTQIRVQNTAAQGQFVNVEVTRNK